MKNPAPCHFCPVKLTRHQDRRRGTCADCGAPYDLPYVFVAVCSAHVDRHRHAQQAIVGAPVRVVSLETFA